MRYIVKHKFDYSAFVSSVRTATTSHEVLSAMADYMETHNVVELPCNIGDDIYIISTYGGKPIGDIIADKVRLICITKAGIHIGVRQHSSFNKTYMLGKTAFATLEDAELALKNWKEK